MVCSLHVSLVFAFLLTAVGTGGALRQRQNEDSECKAISNNIDPILGPCRESARECLEAPEIGSIEEIQSLICSPRAGNLHSTLVRCEGPVYADQIYGGVCGSIENSSTSCVDAILTINDGQEAKDACCGAASGSGNSCGTELQRLSRETGCCVGTAVFQFFFADCGGGLDELFQGNDLELPPLCMHLFSDGVGQGVASSTPWRAAVAVAVIVVYCVVNIMSS